MRVIGLFVFILSQSLFAFGQKPSVSSGTIERLEKFGSKYVDARNIDVWLPSGYDRNQKYAVLYLQDGQMLFDSSQTWNKQEWGVDETMSNLIANKTIRPCIIVGIHNNGALRRNEYFPQKPFESLTKTEKDSVLSAPKNGNTFFAEGNVLSDNYLRFLVQELKPFIDATFSTKTDAANTFVGGSSMGGLISWYAVCEYPKIFGGAACLSTHWVGGYPIANNPAPKSFMRYLKKKLPSPNTHKFYFDCGTATLDAYYPPFQSQADLVLKEKGYGESNFLTKTFVGDEHSEKAWRNRLAYPLAFLLRP